MSDMPQLDNDNGPFDERGEDETWSLEMAERLKQCEAELTKANRELAEARESEQRFKKECEALVLTMQEDNA
jgi:hypothetical protein